MEFVIYRHLAVDVEIAALVTRQGLADIERWEKDGYVEIRFIRGRWIEGFCPYADHAKESIQR